MPDAIRDTAAEIAAAALEVFKGSLTGFIERQEVDEFAKERIQGYTREWWAARTAATEAERQEHEANLRHLVAQARGEARRLQIAISTEAKDTIGRVLETIGGMLIKALPIIIAAL
jgi:hypothetical protein